jgi:hypothetical protein
MGELDVGTAVDGFFIDLFDAVAKLFWLTYVGRIHPH